MQHSPTYAQYPSPAPQDGLIRLARGWFDSLGNLVVPDPARTGAKSPDAFQYTPPSRPVARSPTDFQYDAQSRTTTTVDVDGGTKLFDDLKSAAKDTLLTGLDGLLDDISGRGRAQPVQVNDVRSEFAGMPIGGVIAVAVVGAFIYMKWG